MTFGEIKDLVKMFGNAITMLAILTILAVVLTLTGGSNEIQMGLIVVIAIVALLFLMIVMAGVFKELGLAAPNQPFGLPDGSVRALIALFLIMIFIIMSVYLFRTLVGEKAGTVNGLTAAQVTEFSGQILEVKPNASGTFDATLRTSVPTAAAQLALQLVTILGTLVTAVSAFYFGATTSARRANTTPSTQNTLSINSAKPSSAIVATNPVVHV